MSVVTFIGGPLNGQKLRMDVYTNVIPITKFGFDTMNRPNVYYQNVQPAQVNDQLENELRTVYVLHINGIRSEYIDRGGNYVSKPQHITE